MSIGNFFFNDTATTEIYTLSLHDALPIYPLRGDRAQGPRDLRALRAAVQHGAAAPAARPGAPHDHPAGVPGREGAAQAGRSEEHTSELQSRQYLVCRLLLEKKTILLYPLE